MAKIRSKVPPVSTKATTTLDVNSLKQIVDLLEESEVTRLEWTNGKEKLVIRRGPLRQAETYVSAPIPLPPPPPPRAFAPGPSAPRITPRPPPAPEPEKKGHVITSPFVGTFYRSPSPDQPAFAEVGGMVKKGQVLCIIEAMKLMNEIESEVAGRLAEVLVQNNQPVEFGQALFRIEAA